MARREYRDRTGKLLGYSQNETDRTGSLGKWGAYAFLAFIGFELLKGWLGF